MAEPPLSTETSDAAVAAANSTTTSSASTTVASSSSPLRSLQNFVSFAVSNYSTYEDAVFNKLKEELTIVKEHPTEALGIGVAASLLLLRGPRRFLFRHTFGRLLSEEARFIKAEKSVQELNLSVDVMKNESRKLLERAALAEKDMKHGHTELMDAGSEIRRLAKSVYKVEAQATDLMDGLREIPGREALKLRAEVASMASLLKKQRTALDTQILKISELGVSV